MTCKSNSQTKQPDHSRSRLLKVAIGGTGAQVANMVCAMLALTVCQRYWGDEGVGFYTQMRRFSSLLVPVLIIGQNNALTRYLAMAHDDEKQRVELSAVASLVALIVFGATSGLCIIYPSRMAALILGNSRFAGIMVPFAMSLLGKGLGEIGGAYLRGRFMYITIQAVSMVFSGSMSLFLLLLLREQTIGLALWLIGFIQLTIGACFSGYLLLRGLKWNCSFLRPGRFWTRFRTLYVYGTSRLPVMGLNLIMVGFVSWQFANKAGLDNLGFFNSMTALAMVLNIVAISMSFTLLPMLSLRLKEKGISGCTGIVETLLMAGVTLGLFFTLQMFLFGSSCAQALLQQFVEVSFWWGIVYGLVLGLILYNITDRVLNAYSTFPYSIIGLAVGVACMYAAWWLTGSLIDSMVTRVGLSVSVGYLMLGVISCSITAKVYKVRFPGGRQWLGVGWAVVIFVTGLLEYSWTQNIPLNWRAWIRISALLVNTIIFAIGLRTLRVPWVLHIIPHKKTPGIKKNSDQGRL